MSEIQQLKKEIAELKKSFDKLKTENDQLQMKTLDLEDKNDDLQQMSKKILRDKNEELDKCKKMMMELQLQNGNLEKENFELRQQIELDESRTYGSQYSEKPKLSEIPTRINEQPSSLTKPKSKSVSFQEQQEVFVVGKDSQSKGANEAQASKQEDSKEIERQQTNEINQELVRRNSKLMMIVEQTNEVYNTSQHILMDLNLQISGLLNEKADLQGQVADLEDYIGDQQNQIVLLMAENKELIERLDLQNITSAHKGNNITNSTQATVADFINNLQQEECNEQVDWVITNSIKRSDRTERERECYNQPNFNDFNQTEPQITAQSHSAEYNHSHSKNGQIISGTQDETVILKYNGNQKGEISPKQLQQQQQQQQIEHKNSQSINESQILNVALGNQIQELTQKLQILQQKLADSEKLQTAKQLENDSQVQSLKQQLLEKDEQVVQLKLHVSQMEEKLNLLEEEVEVQKTEFDSTIDELYSQYEQKLQQIGAKHDIQMIITQN